MKHNIYLSALSKILCVTITLFIVGSATIYGQEEQTRSVKLMDKGWEFRLSPDSLSNKKWEKVTIPHDWAIFGPFDRANDLQEVAIIQNNESVASVKTGRTGGLPYMGIGWYRNTFDFEKENYMVQGGRRATLLFDGSMGETILYINGNKVCYNPYGYSAFHCDITDYLTEDGKNNTILVRIENKPLSSRWYPGGGLFRNIHLIETNKVHIPVWGTQITTETPSDKKYSIATIFTTIEGIDSENLTIETEIYDANGISLVETSEYEVVKVDTLSEKKTIVVKQNLKIIDPQLWSPETPYLYSAKTKVFVRYLPSDSPSNIYKQMGVAAKLILSDTYSTTFGIRTLEVVPHKGFYLNGERRKFKGVCLHHDLGPLGAAVNKSAIRMQLKLLKEMGCDAIRTTHNMPATELVMLCDEMGFMVIVENFDEWDVAKCTNGYHRFFNDWAEKDMVNMIKHFRNNPSVVMWSIGNEVPTQWKKEGYRVAKFLKDICHREDPSRLVTCGMDQVDAVLNNGFAAIMDVPGLNYRTHKYKEAYDKLPQKVILGSETASTVSSRSVYKFPAEKRDDALYSDHQSSSYDLEYCSWSNTPDEDFALSNDYDWTMGQFVWTGFDYLGEPSPYDTDNWPNHSSMFGIIDLASIPKDRYYLYKSQWNKTENTLHILPHWNWKGREGEKTPVFVYTSYPAAELFINGKSFGKREKNDSTLQNRYRLMWYNAIYTPGEVMVRAFDHNGQIAEEKYVKTSGKPYRLQLTTNRKIITPDGKDLAYITVRILDKNGNLCPTSDKEIQIKVSGDGHFKAIANGDPTCLTPFHIPKMRAFGGMLTAIVQSSENNGKITIKGYAKGLKQDTIHIRTDY